LHNQKITKSINVENISNLKSNEFKKQVSISKISNNSVSNTNYVMKPSNFITSQFDEKEKYQDSTNIEIKNNLSYKDKEIIREALSKHFLFKDKTQLMMLDLKILNIFFCLI